MKNKTYLITGASGFIGSVLLRELLKRGEKIHLVLRRESNTWRIKDLLKKTKVHESDLQNPKLLEKIITKSKPDIIYHLATNGAYSHQKNIDQIIETNIIGTWNLLKSCEMVDYELFVNTGTSSEYGFKKYAMREIDSLEPTSCYATTKAYNSLFCSYFARENKKPIVTIRPFSVYGPWEEPNRFFTNLMSSLYYRKPMDLVSPQISRDFVFVGDLVNAYLKINQLKKNPGECFNIGTGIQYNLKQITKLAVRVTKRTTDFRWGKMNQRKDRDTNTWVADISKARNLLSWYPQHDLKTGLELTWKWFLEHHQIYK